VAFLVHFCCIFGDIVSAVLQQFFAHSHSMFGVFLLHFGSSFVAFLRHLWCIFAAFLEDF